MTSLPTDIGDLHCFVIERLPELPVARRIVLLNTLAEVIGSADLAGDLRREAAALAAIEQSHQQLLLKFRGGQAA